MRVGRVSYGEEKLGVVKTCATLENFRKTGTSREKIPYGEGRGIGSVSDPEPTPRVSPHGLFLTTTSCGLVNAAAYENAVVTS